VNDSPAENKLCEITCCDVTPFSEEGYWMNLCLVLNAEFKLFNYMCSQLAIYNQFSHPVPVMFICQEFEREIPL
jgi:hypothetical protein